MTLIDQLGILWMFVVLLVSLIVLTYTGKDD
jgi:hypothetical protein